MLVPYLLAGLVVWSAAGTEMVVAGQRFDVGRPVVLWNDAERGFNGYSEVCLEEAAKRTSPCCRGRFRRFGKRPGVRTLKDLQGSVTQLILHHDGCVNSRSCFYSMHDMPRADGGCGLSAHFMIDADGTIYQTLDLLERAFHAEESNTISIGVEICNRADASRDELSRLPAEYGTRPVFDVVINGRSYRAFDFRPEQYRSVVALARAIVRVFPRLPPAIPEEDGQPIMSALESPQSFAGILGHLHVDRQRRKWDPGAFDWNTLTAALNGYYLPTPVRGHVRFPLYDIATISRVALAAFESSEERSSAFFPIGPGTLRHSGVNLRGVPGTPVVVPARGQILAARMGRRGRSSTSFVLTRHEIPVGEDVVRFFSLLAHLEPMAITPADRSPFPWMAALAQSGNRQALSAMKRGQVTLLNIPVEAGEIVGQVGFVKRGAEIGPETRFEIFTAAALPRAMAQYFREETAVSDGAWMRRPRVLELLNNAGVATFTARELAEFYRSDNLDARQALRRLAIRHRHEWGNRTRADDFVASPDLRALSAEDRRRIYDEAIAPYLFWNDRLSAYAGLPRDQVVVSYNPIAFLAALAAAQAGGRLTWPAADLPSGEGVLAAPTAQNLAPWISPPPEPSPDPPIFGRLVRTEVTPKKVSEIPLLPLPSLDRDPR